VAGQGAGGATAGAGQVSNPNLEPTGEGCSCSTAGASGNPSSGLLAMLGFCAITARRRRR
jgi:MYXO-CTERM domain-containing protein